MDGHQYTAQFEAPDGKPILAVYPDPLTGGAPWTVGLGHTGPDVHEGDVWTADRCWHAFYNDYSIASGEAPHVIGASAFSGLNDQRKAVIVDLCFNPGPTKLVLFHQTIDAIQKRDWKRASDELLDSAYAKQVEGRAIKNAHVLLTGAWPGEELTA